MSIARSYHDKAGGAPWSNWVLNCDLAQGDRSPEKFVRVGVPSSTNDLKTYDVGQLNVCTEGTAAATVGYLEVEYVVDLMTAQIQDPVGGSVLYTSNVTHIFLTVGTLDPDAVLPFTTDGGMTMTFYQSWEGLMLFCQSGSVMSALTAAATGTVGGAVTQTMSTVINGAATNCVAQFSVRALPGTILTFTPTATTVTQTVVYFGTAAYRSLDLATSSVSVSSSSPVVPVLDLTKLEPRTDARVPTTLLSQSMIDEVIAARKKR
jgi:hypothetical protein